jgi:hypothetical protein
MRGKRRKEGKRGNAWMHEWMRKQEKKKMRRKEGKDVQYNIYT